MPSKSPPSRRTEKERTIDPVARITSTEVVDLTDADLAEIHDLRTRALDFFEEVGDPPPTPASFQADLDDLPDGFSRADEAIYRAYRGTRVAGYAEVLRGFPEEGQWIVGILLVDADMRGEGIGRAVVEEIARDARAAGMTAVVVGVISTRERSLAFWRREGFTIEVRRRPIVIGDVQAEVVRLERRLESEAPASSRASAPADPLGQLHVRPIAGPDVPAVARLFDTTLGSGYWTLDLGAIGCHRLAMAEDRLVAAASAVLVDDIGTPVDLPGPIGLVRIVAVDPSARRCGVATRLVSEVADGCVDLGARSFAAYAWVHGRTGVAPLAGSLRRLGFLLERRIEHFYAADGAVVCPECGCTPCVCAADLYVMVR